MKIIYDIKKSKRLFKYGDIVEYSNTDICIVSQGTNNRVLLIVLRTGGLLRSFENIEELNTQEGVTFLCENDNVTLILPKQ